MAKFVLKHPILTIDGTELQDKASSLEITTEYEEVDFTSFCNDFKEVGQGLGDCTWTVDFFQDFGAVGVDAILWPLSQSGTVFPISATSGSAEVSQTNPLFSMNARMFSYSPIAGNIGDASTTSVTFRCGDDSGLVKTTSPAVYPALDLFPPFIPAGP